MSNAHLFRTAFPHGPRMTFFNHGTPFSFRVDQMTKHPSGKYGATMLKVHAELALQANDHDVYILDVGGHRLDDESLREYAQSGVLAQNDVKIST